MATKAGVGYSDNPESREAGTQAAMAAMAEAGLTNCDLAIMYSTSKHDPEQLRDGVRSVIGPQARLIGGYAVGIITKDRLGYEGYQVGVAVIASDSLKVDMFIERNLPDNEYNVGLALGKKIRGRDYQGVPNILLMYDSIKAKPPENMSINLNMATPLIAGMKHSLGTWPPAAGVGMIGDFGGNMTYQWFDSRIEQHTAMALVLSGGARLDTVIMHGCRPSSGYHTISKVDNAIVLEIDGKPALNTIEEMLGPDSYRDWEDYPFFVTLGVNKGDKFGEFKEEDYANRLVMGIDKMRGGLIMFENDLKAGDEIQLMRRSINFDYIEERARECLDRLGNRRPFLALYIDCGGRASAFSGTEGEEAEKVQQVVSPHMPLLGMYSGVEIAKIRGEMQALDWTGVLCILSE